MSDPESLETVPADFVESFRRARAILDESMSSPVRRGDVTILSEHQITQTYDGYGYTVSMSGKGLGGLLDQIVGAFEGMPRIVSTLAPARAVRGSGFRYGPFYNRPTRTVPSAMRMQKLARQAERRGRK